MQTQPHPFRYDESSAPGGNLSERQPSPASAAVERSTGRAGSGSAERERVRETAAMPAPAPVDPDDLPDEAYDPHDFYDFGGICV